MNNVSSSTTTLKAEQKKSNCKKAPIVEPLEARVLYSVDPFGFATEGPDGPVGRIASDIVFPDTTLPETPALSIGKANVSITSEFAPALDLKPALNDYPVSDIHSTELVFISTLIPEHEQIKNEFLSKTNPNRLIQVIKLEAFEGINKITKSLALHNEVDSIHIISHGQADRIQIGNDVINFSQTQTEQLRQWSGYLSNNADLLFYGCNLAEKGPGKELLRKISAITDAGVAASTDLTGASSLGGNWALEFETELIESTLVAEALESSSSLLQSINVDTNKDIVDAPDLSSVDSLLNNRGDDSKISLREAILAANAEPTADIIYLNTAIYHTTEGSGNLAGDFDIFNPLTIIGSGDKNTKIDGGNHDRVFDFQNATDAAIYAVEIRNGTVDSEGGGIYSTGTNLKLNSVEIHKSKAASGGALFINADSEVHLNNVHFHNNEASDSGGSISISESNLNGSNVVIKDSRITNSDAGTFLNYKPGGAIWNGGALSVYRTTISGNTAGDGGGIYNTGALYIADSIFSKNESKEGVAAGGATFNEGTQTVERSLFHTNKAVLGGAAGNIGTAIFNDSNFAENSASVSAGVIYQGLGNAAVIRSTIADNYAPINSAILIAEGTVSMASTIVERNVDSTNINIAAYVDGNFVSQGYNISEFAIPQALETDLQNTNAGISDKLEVKGGYTSTYTIGASSPAVNAGMLVNQDSALESIVDVTGITRGSVADSGAYEYREPDAADGPAVTVNKKLQINEDSTSIITASKLYATDPDLPDIDMDTIVFEVQAPYPSHGSLLVDATPLSAENRTFTLMDIIENKVAYQHNGTAGTDSFDFTVTDGSFTTPSKTFQIEVLEVNDAPVISSFEAINVKENQPTPIVPTLLVSDEDNINIEYAEVKFTSGYNSGQDTLSSTDGGIWNPSTGVLLFANRDSVENIQAALRNVVYQNSSDTPDTTQRKLSILVSDGDLKVDIVTALDVSAVNDPPEILNLEAATLEYPENSPAASVSQSLTIKELDSAQLHSAKVSLTAPSYNASTETLSATTVGSIVADWNSLNGTLRLTGTDTVANYLNVLRSLKYENTSESPSTTEQVVEITVTDQSNASSAIATRSISVLSVNDPPSANDQTITTLEDTPITLKLANFGFSDSLDNHALQSVKIVRPPINNTLTLNNNPVSADQLINRSDIQANKLVFTPPPAVNGSEYAALTFRVTDDGGTANSGANTSQADNTLTFNVSSVNDPPIGSDGSVNAIEDQDYIFRRIDFGFSDPDDGNLFGGVLFTQVPDKGSFTLMGEPIYDNTPVSIADIDANRLRYKGPNNGFGNAFSYLQFKVFDDGLTGPNHNNIDISQKRLTINLSPVNDPPTATDFSVTTLEDSPVSIQLNDFGFSDSVDNNALQAVKIVRPPINNTLTLNNNPVSADQLINRSDIQANKLVFTPPPAVNGSEYAALTFRVTDDGGTANSGANTSQADNTLTFNVSSVNDPPIGSDGAVNAIEDQDYIFRRIDFGFSDPDDGNLFGGVLFTQVPDKGSFTLMGEPIYDNTPVSIADIDANRLRYKGPNNDFGNAFSYLQFKVFDDGLTGPNHNNIDISPKRLTINLSPVNDPPTATDFSVTTLEDSPVSIQLNDFGFSDSVDNNALQAVKIVRPPINNTLTLNNNPVSADQLINRSDIQANKLVFTPPPAVNGSEYAALMFRVTDDGGTANSGANTSQADNTLTFNVSSVNDPPIGSDGSVNAIEDQDYIFRRIDFGFSDPDDGNLFGGVLFTQVPDKGSFTLMGEPIYDNTPVSIADIDANRLRYKGPNNGFGNAFSYLQFKVFDDGLTGPNHNNIDISPKRLTINLSPVNDPPLATDFSVTTLEDSPVSIQLNDFGFNDSVDNNALQAVKIVRPPINNTLTLNNNPVSADQLINRSDIQANKLVFTPPPAVNGSEYAALTFRVTDDGGTANSGANTSQADNTLTFNVSSVNDPPIGSDGSVNAMEDQDYIFRRIDFGFSDPDDGNLFGGVLFTQVPDKGSFTLLGEPIYDNTPVSIADIDANRLRYKGPNNGFGNAFSYLQFKVFDDGLTGPNHNNIDISPKRLTINLSPVNDPPTATDLKIITLENESTAITIEHLGFQDAYDNDELLGLNIVSIPDRGKLTIQGQGVSLGQLVTTSQLHTGELQFTPDPQDSGSKYTYFSFRVVDDGGTDNEGIDTAILTNTVYIDVTAEIVYPIAANSNTKTLENQPLQLKAADFNIQSAENAQPLKAIIIDNIPIQGQLTLYGNVVEALEIITIESIEAGELIYQPPVQVLDAMQDSYSFQLHVGGDLTTFDTPTGSESYTMTVDILPVNEAPIAVSNTIYVGENLDYRFAIADFPYNDNQEHHALKSVIIESTPARGQLKISDAIITKGTVIGSNDLQAGQLVFTPDAHSYDEDYSSFKFRVVDSGGTAFGASATSQSSEMNITVHKTRKPHDSITTNLDLAEDSVLFLTKGSFGLGGIDETGPVAGIMITSLPVSGEIRLHNAIVSLGQKISLFDIESSQMSYTPEKHRNGPAIDTLLFKVLERNGATSISPDVNASASTTVFTVYSINDAPTDIDLTSTEITEHSKATEVSKILVSDVDATETASITVNDDRFYITNDGLYLKEGVDIDFEKEQKIPLAFTATDEFGATLEKVVTLHVKNIFEAPIAKTDSVTHVIPLDKLGETVSIELDNTLFTDPDNDKLTYRATLSDGSPLPSWMTFDAANQKIVLDTQYSSNDPVNIKIIATDPMGASAVLKLHISFPPTIAAAKESISQTPFDTNQIPSKPTSASKVEVDENIQQPTENETAAKQEEDTTLEYLASPSHPEFSPTSIAANTLPPLTVKEHSLPKKIARSMTTPGIQSETQTDVDRQTVNANSSTYVLLSNLVNNLNETREQFGDTESIENLTKVTSVAISTGLSVGYIIWLLRGGVIVASMMSSVPAWRFVDPLPVLDNQDEDDNGDNESLETIVDRNDTKKIEKKRNQLNPKI